MRGLLSKILAWFSPTFPKPLEAAPFSLDYTAEIARLNEAIQTLSRAILTLQSQLVELENKYRADHTPNPPQDPRRGEAWERLVDWDQVFGAPSN